MHKIPTNTKLYYLLTGSDGQVHEKEEEIGNKMLWHEAINQDNFVQDLQLLAALDDEAILNECIQELKTYSKNDQINSLAWMCLIANADGFMDKQEWALIYQLYHKHLGLDLSEVMQRQKELFQYILKYKDDQQASFIK